MGKNVFHLDKWNFELVVFCTYYTELLALVKVLLRYIWRWFAKCSSSSCCSACGDTGLNFYSACGDRWLKQTKKIFSNKCPQIFSIWPNWKKEVLSGRGRQEWCKVRLPQIAFSFNETKFFLLWNVNNPTPSFAVF